jgi:hypothetical protein
MMMMVVTVVGGVLLSLLASEVEKWLPWVSTRLIRYEALKLPRLSERMQEQWQADLDEIPGNVGKLCYALSLVLRHFAIVRTLPADEAEDADPVVVSAVGISAGSTVIGVTGAEANLTGHHMPKVFISSSHHGLTLSAELNEALRVLDADHVQPSNLVRLHGSFSAATKIKRRK